MATKPTTLHIRERAERRCAELGITKPDPGTPSFDAKERTYQERFDRQLADAEVALNRAYKLEQQREDAAASLEQQRLDAQVDQLKANYLAQPGTTLNDFQRALPELLAESRKEAAFGAETEFQRQLAETRRRGGSVL